jgi:hypothetical protein
MLHGRLDRKSNAAADEAAALILSDQDEFGKAIGEQLPRRQQDDRQGN